ncbi:MAG TPA: hypothetical protein DEE98_00865 [Elusimicrobia bacterium]|nr:MAG: hypothetical protein A2278_03480 [Elusimicrobia bacterium RIFOXYA12_FULL_49_49]OGS15620.1 MAG: hypothetical protein A2251_03730 [Elusimicrobia bacterium RIFOXYA2_FULL_47_53]OGS26824.1 MAG: hypothetical protein A2339_07250 [Elusimicrobia bacterium RIFOXYB12_FULL_50_12]OGS30719.1 MAG: hypothetical protein A2323_07535 [Elusimicrobia bacterium RIFOXYB2_FULL_46_23]HBU68916.1 hypothetical protein [Elusimicrobiota bacterium]
MKIIDTFVFSDDHKSNEGDLIIKIPCNIKTENALFDVLLKGLSFPYFGWNWNALDDCLHDFEWLRAKKIIIQHDDLPQMPVNELKIYLEVLSSAVYDWMNDSAHDFVVVFPVQEKAQIVSIVGEETVMSKFTDKPIGEELRNPNK